MTTLVRHMLANKAEVHAVAPDDTVLDALRVMADRNIGAVLVMHGDALAGILSERDYARKMVLHGKASPACSAGNEVADLKPEYSPVEQEATCSGSRRPWRQF